VLATATQATAAIYFRCKRRQVLEKDEDQVEMDGEDTLGKGYIRRGKGIGKRGIFSIGTLLLGEPDCKA